MLASRRLGKYPDFCFPVRVFAYHRLSRCQRLLLECGEFSGAFDGQGEQGVHFGSGEGGAFGGALDFDVAAVGGHDDVHVGVAGGVFSVVEIQSGLAANDAHVLLRLLTSPTSLTCADVSWPGDAAA